MLEKLQIVELNEKDAIDVIVLLREHEISDVDREAINSKYSREKKAGNLDDSYTGNRLKRNANVDLDHTISSKEIHDDPGRVLAEMDGPDIANTDSNLNPTDRSINRSKQRYWL